MYKCGKCGKSSQPGQSKQVITKHHMIWDENQKKELHQIKYETPVCSRCKAKEVDDCKEV